MQHRVFGAEEYLPSAVRIAQHRFNEACASLLKQMADVVDGNAPDRSADLDASLAELSRSLQEAASNDTRFLAARGLENLSKRIRDLITELSQEIGRSHLNRTIA
jgi:hypothetical protein